MTRRETVDSREDWSGPWNHELRGDRLGKRIQSKYVSRLAGLLPVSAVMTSCIDFEAGISSPVGMVLSR